jgi:pimeloyl-ACP methyl ester carboxylesterase
MLNQIKTFLLSTIGILSLNVLFMLTASGQQIKSGVDTLRYGDNPSAGNYVKIRGFNMYYETYGKGEPLLIVHGNSGSISRFLYQIPYFAKNYKVIVADSRAQGKSIDPTDSLSYEMMTDDLNALLDHLHLKSCYVIGWSDGGINGLSRPTPGMKNRQKLYRLLSYEPHIPVTDLQKITCPVLVIGGDHDAILPKHTMLIAQAIPHSYLWIIPNSGHATPVKKRMQFNQVVADFFSQPFRTIEGEDRFH